MASLLATERCPVTEADLQALRPPDRALPVERRDEIKNMLAAVVRSEGAPSSATASTRRRRRLGSGIAIAVAVVGLGGAAAAGVITRDRPDVSESARVNEEIGRESPAAEVHLDGWRPELSAEVVECVVPAAVSVEEGGPPQVGTIQTPASEFPLEDLLTRDAVVQECLSGNDAARNSSTRLSADAGAVCVRTGVYPKPVVLLDGTTCDYHAHLRLLTDRDLATLNRLRSFDVALLAVPSADGCPGVDEAVEWARARVAEFGGGLRIHVMDEGPACYRAVADWTRRVVTVQLIGPQQPNAQRG